MIFNSKWTSSWLLQNAARQGAGRVHSDLGGWWIWHGEPSWGFDGDFLEFTGDSWWELHGGLKKGYILQFHQTSTGDFPMDYPPAIKFRRKIPQISIFPTNLHRVWGFSNGHVWLPEGTVSTVWWFQPTPLKNHGVSKSWDDEIPQLNGKKTCSKPPTRLRWQLGIGTNDNGPGWKR